MKTKIMYKQKGESQDYVTNASCMTHLLITMKQTATQNPVLQEHIGYTSSSARTIY